MKMFFKGDINELEFGINEIAPAIGVDLDENGYVFEVKKEEGSDIMVFLDGEKGSITYSQKHHFFRALGLAAEKIADGCRQFSIKETPKFKTIGTMLESSQCNALFNMRYAKGFIRQLALMGQNMLMFYCEDTYEVKEQPMFGYMRPKYTAAEFKELDDYAFNLGIELIPCIQTLAHLSVTLKWKCFDKISDYDDCLLVGNEDTYKLIKDLLVAASSPFRSKKIHIGMDEAFRLGSGKYLKQNGYRPPKDIMLEHVNRVYGIVKELGLEPMMWDDMFFSTIGDGKHNQRNLTVPDEVRSLVPKDMKIVYWTYSPHAPEAFDDYISQRFQLSDKVMFAGGSHGWFGFAYSFSNTYLEAQLALDSCKRNNVEEVMITTWGGVGSECPKLVNLIGCQLYAEHGYTDGLTKEGFSKRFKFCTGGNVEDFEKLEYIDRIPQTEKYPIPANYNSSRPLMWQDILSGLADKNFDGFENDVHYEKLAQSLKAAVGRNGQFDPIFEFEYYVAKVLSMKAQMGLRITASYKQNDKAALKMFAENELPELKKRVEKLRVKHRDLWFKYYKNLGWDVCDIRYGGLISRIDSAIYEITAYLDGTMEKIEELEVERQYFNGYSGPIPSLWSYTKVATPSRMV